MSTFPEYKTASVSSLIPYARNSRTHSDEQVSKDGWVKVQGRYRKCWKHSECTPVTKPGKHRYLMPLDAEMRQRIMPLSKPYPKRVTKANSGDQPESGGAVPTDTLQSSGEADNA